MYFILSTVVAISMATMATAAALPPPHFDGPPPPLEGALNARADSGIIAHTYNGTLIVSGGTATVDFDSLSEEQKEKVLAECPAFVDGVDGNIDTACF